jgi:cytochrome c1
LPGIALIAVACGIAGCGATASQPSGAQVFAEKCAACHSVIGNESRHRVGGDLLGYRISRQQLTEFTREMPVRKPLTHAELSAVVDYLYSLQQRR